MNGPLYARLRRLGVDTAKLASANDYAGTSFRMIADLLEPDENPYVKVDP